MGGTAMQALVTGGTGFIGSAVVRELLRDGVRVVCLVRPNSDLRNLVGLDVTLVQGDLNAPDSLRAALQGCQQLYHVAAYYSTRPEDAPLMQRINVEGSLNVLQAAAEAGLTRIVHTSTIGTIGRPKSRRLPTEEDLFDDWDRASPYARSKLEAEAIAMRLASQGAPIVVVNPCAPVGARDIKPSSTGARIIAYLQGRVPSFSPGGINFIGVEDVARGHLLAAQKGRPGERYILGHAQGNLTRDGFYALMQRVSGVGPPEQRTALGLGRVRRVLREWLQGNTLSPNERLDYRPAALTADPTRAIRELGLPQTPLEVAFRQAIIWFRANGYV